MNIEKVIDMRDANEACDLQNNCNECIISYEKMTPCNFIRNKYKDSIWNYKEESRQLEEYIKNNPNEKLMTGLTVLDKWYIRPMNWCGMWKKNKLLGAVKTINGKKVRVYSLFTTGVKWFKRAYYSCRKKYYLKT